jgi:SAM-dependent methyltransferase
MAQQQGKSDASTAMPPLDSAHAEAGRRLAALSELFDRDTFRALDEAGVSAGWRCLEVGAGDGSVADWLCRRVGPDGSVVATEIEMRHLHGLHHDNLHLLTHDIIAGPVEEGTFDLVHARLLLIVVPDRERALANMVASVKPGGLIVCEEFDSLSMLPDARINPAETSLPTLAAMRTVMEARGADVRFGRLLAGRFRAHGLVGIAARGTSTLWAGGSAGARLLRANFMQMRESMIASGLITERDFAEDIERLDAPETLLPSPIMWTVQGRRP